VRGAVEVRGEAVVAIELVAALGLPAADLGGDRCLLVVDAGATAEGAVVGLIADALGDLLEEEGVAPQGEGSLRVLDLERLLRANPWVRGPADLAASPHPPAGETGR
jgi:hypothetical protein